MIAYMQTVGAQHEAIDKHMKHFLELEFKKPGGKKAAEAEEDGGEPQASVAEREIQEMVTMHFQLVMDSAGAGEAAAADGNADPGAAAAPTQSNILSLFGGGGGNKAALKAEAEKVKEWMNNDPRRRQLQVMTKAEKQALFREDVDAMRRKLEKVGQDYGNVTYQRIDKASRSGLLTLRGLGVRALPPEVSRLTGTAHSRGALAPCAGSGF